MLVIKQYNEKIQIQMEMIYEYQDQLCNNKIHHHLFLKQVIGAIQHMNHKMIHLKNNNLMQWSLLFIVIVSSFFCVYLL